MARRNAPPPLPRWTPAEREATLASAHVILLSFPFPHRLVELALAGVPPNESAHKRVEVEIGHWHSPSV